MADQNTPSMDIGVGRLPIEPDARAVYDELDKLDRRFEESKAKFRDIFDPAPLEEVQRRLDRIHESAKAIRGLLDLPEPGQARPAVQPPAEPVRAPAPPEPPPSLDALAGTAQQQFNLDEIRALVTSIDETTQAMLEKLRG